MTSSESYAHLHNSEDYKIHVNRDDERKNFQHDRVNCPSGTENCTVRRKKNPQLWWVEAE